MTQMESKNRDNSGSQDGVIIINADIEYHVTSTAFQISLKHFKHH